jgi:hypothetical protein
VPARSVEIAQAIVDALNGQTFSQPFTAVRTWQSVDDLADLGEGSEYHVAIHNSPDITSELSSRKEVVDTHTIRISLRKKIDADNQDAEIDDAVALVEEMRTFLEPAGSEPFNPIPTAYYDASEVPFHFLPDDLNEHNLFRCVMTFEYVDSR